MFIIKYFGIMQHINEVVTSFLQIFEQSNKSL